ncbi:unnamed protein product [Protopolystoma xenopodis]|uniref:Uncharacterized protein n=1 Tax=Protopolystoma xenopodis TaxID=117903 RepID=A0A448WYK9_9PLAT|nr:unnamed protein product [Protopolystoma xenopodis]
MDRDICEESLGSRETTEGSTSNFTVFKDTSRRFWDEAESNDLLPLACLPECLDRLAGRLPASPSQATSSATSGTLTSLRMRENIIVTRSLSLGDEERK